MKLSTEEKYKKQLDKKYAAQQRARERQLERLKDPAYIAKQKDKQLAYNQRQREKAIEKSKVKQVVKPVKRKATSAIKSKGLFGRTPTSFEKRVMNKIGALPCAACSLQGRLSPIVSLHHIDGRTKDNCHCRVLPLCAYHHDTPVDKAIMLEYPDLIPIHAKNAAGGRAAWQRQNGTEYDVLKYVLEQIDIELEAVL